MALNTTQTHSVRPVSHFRRRVLVLFAAILCGLGLLVFHWVPFQRALYRAKRQCLIWQTEWHLRGDHRVVDAHFLVLYPPGHQKSAEEIAHLASDAYAGEIANLGIHPTGRLVIAVYPNRASLNDAVGLPPQQNNIGFYWHGVIDVLGPHGLHQAIGLPLSSYPLDGPVAHELGHALLNLGAYGNYPSWFNEGVAQWEDLRQTGYQWLTAHNDLRTDPLYSLSTLSNDFYQLPHQGLAYREGLGMVEYLAHLGGPNTLANLVHVLGHGTPFDIAIKRTYGSPIQTLFDHWQHSLHRSV